MNDLNLRANLFKLFRRRGRWLNATRAHTHTHTLMGSTFPAADYAHGVGAVKEPHVLVLPFPAQGHILPFLSIAHHLAAHGILVTLVQAHSGFPPQGSAASINGNHFPATETPLIHNETILSGIDNSQPFSVASFSASLDVMHSSFRELLHQKLILQANAPVCLLIDSTFFWGDAIAVEFGLSRVDVWTSSASTLCLGFHLPDLVERGFIPGTKDTIIDFIAGLPPLRVTDLPQMLRTEEGLHLIENAKKADRILVNTMQELELSVIEALRKEDSVPIDPIGPLFRMKNIVPGSCSVKEDDDCLSWLDQQQGSSVLYIAFGSMSSLDENALAELAGGLEASGESFLWVIRSDSYKNKASVEEILPEGFMERTSDRGLVIPWAPQLAVLGHSSVSAFLTHCGWNSVLESLSNGVPMLGLPQRADQIINLKFIVHDWKVGLPLLQEEGTVEKLEQARVQSAITAIMRGDEGLQVRTRAREWKGVAERAIHGSSKDNLQKLVDDLKHGKLKRLKH